jgi:hypothetical protein
MKQQGKGLSRNKSLQSPNLAAENVVIIALLPALPTLKLKSRTCIAKIITADIRLNLFQVRVNDAGNEILYVARVRSLHTPDLLLARAYGPDAEPHRQQTSTMFDSFGISRLHTMRPPRSRPIFSISHNFRSRRRHSHAASSHETVDLAYDLHIFEPCKTDPKKCNRPIIFMHGLFGSRANNRSMSK